MDTDEPQTDPIAVLSQGPLLLYDGECGVCNQSVQWILSHERQHTLRFAPLQSPLGRELRSQSQVSEDVDSLLWIEAHEGQIHAKKWSASVLATLRYVGGPWRALLVLRWIPRPWRDAAYRLFARHRQSVAPKACLLPPVETKARFLGV